MEAGASGGAGGTVAHVAETAAKIASKVTEGFSRAAEKARGVARKPGEMMAKARKPFAGPKSEAATPSVDVLGGPSVAENIVVASATPQPLEATGPSLAEEDTPLSPADAAKAAELTEEARKMAWEAQVKPIAERIARDNPNNTNEKNWEAAENQLKLEQEAAREAARADGGESTTQGSKPDDAEAVAPETSTEETEVSADGKTTTKETTIKRIPKKMADDERFRRIRAKILADARGRNETIDPAVASEQAREAYYREWAVDPRNRVSILVAKATSKDLQNMLKEKRKEAKRAKKNGEKYDMQANIDEAVANWKYRQDILEEDGEKENMLVLIARLLLGFVVGSATQAGKEGVGPTMQSQPR